MEQYLKRDIAKIIKRPTRTIQYWTDEGFVIPDIVPSEGKGKARVYSKTNLIEFAMLEIMCGPGHMYLELYDAKFLLKILRNGGEDESGYQHVMFTGSEDNRFGGSNIPKGSKVLEDFYTSAKWGKTKELACVLSTDFQSYLNEEKHIRHDIEAFFILPKNGDQFVKVYRNWISSIGDSEGFPLVKKIIFLSAIRNAALDMYGIRL